MGRREAIVTPNVNNFHPAPGLGVGRVAGANRAGAPYMVASYLERQT